MTDTKLVIAQALATWNEPSHRARNLWQHLPQDIREDYLNQAATVLSALEQERVAIVALPDNDTQEPTTDDTNGYREWNYPHGSVAVTDDGTIMWGAWHVTNSQKVREAGAALLAAAAAAEREDRA